MISLIVIHFVHQGKEFETRLKEKKPGDLSDDLRTALGMPVGPNNHLVPPPWLIAMQRYGPPPSYPNLKIPGLNAPIPEVRTDRVFFHKIFLIFYKEYKSSNPQKSLCQGPQR